MKASSSNHGGGTLMLKKSFSTTSEEGMTNAEKRSFSQDITLKAGMSVRKVFVEITRLQKLKKRWQKPPEAFMVSLVILARVVYPLQL